MARKERLSIFDDLPWDARLIAINEEFPSTARMDWYKAFEDIELFGRLLRDILKLEQSKPGRSGPRPALERSHAQAKLRQLAGVDYSDYAFKDAFSILANGASQRDLAAKTGLDRNLIQKLLSGKKKPDIFSMEEVARAFEKRPSYFLEWRLAYVIAALASKMSSSPEMTTDLYKRLIGRTVDGSH